MQVNSQHFTILPALFHFLCCNRWKFSKQTGPNGTSARYTTQLSDPTKLYYLTIISLLSSHFGRTEQWYSTRQTFVPIWNLHSRRRLAKLCYSSVLNFTRKDWSPILGNTKASQVNLKLIDTQKHPNLADRLPLSSYNFIQLNFLHFVRFSENFFLSLL